MTSHIPIFFLFIGINIGIGVHSRTKNSKEIAGNLNNPARWRQELRHFPTGLSYKKEVGEFVEVLIGHLPPPDVTVGPGDIKFLLYTPENPLIPDILTFDVASLKKSNYDSSHQTVFVTHGWLSSSIDPSCVLIRKAYLKYSRNVIVIDWSAISVNLLYPESAVKVPAIGRKLGRFIDYLSSEGYLKVSETVLVGHSLGAHVVGIAGSNIGRDQYPKYVVGLDPALPLFKFATSEYRISKDSGEHVHVIHTDAGALGTNKFWGDVSFLMNGGKAQRGCIGPIDACSHFRAYIYFAESISNTDVRFYGLQCRHKSKIPAGTCNGPKKAYMGGIVPDKTLLTDETFNVPVNSHPPFARGIGYLESTRKSID